MKELRFDTGLVSYKINDAVEVAFNPTDAAFIERMFGTFETLKKMQDAYDDEADKTGDYHRFFESARKYDTDMRSMIDDVLGTPVCDALFGRMNVYALADGLPMWCNMMLALMDEIEPGFAREYKATNPRIQKYTAKYHR